MSALRALQLEVLAAVQGGAPQAAAGRVRARGLAPERRLQVHHRHWLSSLTTALATEFPTVAALVGEEFFAWLAARYLNASPLRAGHVRPLGAGLAAFIASLPEAEGLPYLADCARLDRARQDAYHAAEHPPLDRQALARLDPADLERLRFRLHSSCRRIDSGYPLWEIWRLAQGELETVNVDTGGDRLLVSRPHAAVEVRRLGAAAAALIDAIAAGETFAAACEAAATADPAADLDRLVTGLVVDGLVVGFEAGPA